MPATGLDVVMVLGRDGMTKMEWAFLVAVHSDCWLMSVAFYYGFRMDKEERWDSSTALPLKTNLNPLKSTHARLQMSLL